MIREVLSLSVNGEVQDALLADVTEVEVEEHVADADVFRVRVSLTLLPDGTWRHLDDAHLAVWNRLSIRAGYGASRETLVDGYITHVNVVLAGAGGDSYLELSGMDASVVMDLEDRQAAWPNKKVSDVAQEIFASYGLSWEVEDTQELHGERSATLLQSESDIRFLHRLAARHGFECFVMGGTGYFRSPDLQQQPQKPLAVQFGGETNLTSLRFETDGTPATRVEIRRLDPFEKQDQRAVLDRTPGRKLGKRPLAELRGETREGSRILRQQATLSKQELGGRLRAAYEPAAGFVTASGDVDGKAYGAILRAKRLVTIKGAGAALSGHYYVTRVRHRLSADAYVQSFEARRNGLGLLGTESFSAPPALVPVLPGGLGSGRSPGNRVLPAQPTGSSTERGS
jgi:phage protein D